MIVRQLKEALAEAEAQGHLTDEMPVILHLAPSATGHSLDGVAVFRFNHGERVLCLSDTPPAPLPREALQ